VAKRKPIPPDGPIPKLSAAVQDYFFGTGVPESERLLRLHRLVQQYFLRCKAGKSRFIAFVARDTVDKLRPAEIERLKEELREEEELAGH
jgi:hypothetical protein